MRTAEVVTWVAACLAILAVGLACWQLWRARRRTREVAGQAREIRQLAAATEGRAQEAERDAQNARSHARWAWEQLKMAAGRLDEAREEHRAVAKVEQWEWAYAVTTTAGELVDACQELIRVALDGQVAPNYRLSAERHYRQTAQRWQDTMIKALARTEPSLDVQRYVSIFAEVQHRLHGQIGVVLRAAETNALSNDDTLAKQALATSQELQNARRHMQRTISANLTESDQGATQQITSDNGSDRALATRPKKPRDTARRRNDQAAGGNRVR